MDSNIGLRLYRIGNHDAFYIPNFLAEEEEQYILRKVGNILIGLYEDQTRYMNLRDRNGSNWRIEGIASRDHDRLKRAEGYTRLQIWGGEITTKGLLPQSLPSYMTVYPDIIKRLKQTGVFADSPHQEPNHVILNEYHPGQGIMPHEDGPKYFPAVATISLGSHAVFNYYRYKPNHLDSGDDRGRVIDKDPILSVLLEPRSLVVSSGEMYTSYLHGIDPVEEDHILLPIPSTVLQASESHEPMTHRTIVGNWNLLGDKTTNWIAANGGVLQRGTRYSLTCRDVGRISSARSFRLR